MSLGNRDLEVLQHALLELHEERDLESFREAVPAILLKVVPGDGFTWLEFGFRGLAPSMRKFVLWDSPPTLTPKLLRRLVSLQDQHPFTIQGRRTGGWGPWRLSDFWTRRQMRASPIHREVYRLLDVEHLLACALFRGNRVGTINIRRSAKRRDFSERDRRMLALLAPHFAQALRSAELATARRDSGSEPLSSLGLTRREAEVALWLERGRTNPEIGSVLGMHSRTVEKHVERILIKLGVENRTTAARLISGKVALGSSPGPAPAKRLPRG